MQSRFHDLAVSVASESRAGADGSLSPITVAVLVLLAVVLVILLIRLLRAGIHKIPEGEVAVVERLGRFARLVGPGLVWVTPNIEQLKHSVYVRLREEQFIIRNLWFRDVVQVDIEFTICYWLDLYSVNPSLLRDIAYRSATQWRASIEDRAARILRDLISQCDLMDLIGQDPLFREEIERTFVRRLKQVLGEWGVRLDQLGGAWLRDIGLTAELQQALNSVRRTDVDTKTKGAVFDMIRQRYPGLSDIVLLSLFNSILGGEGREPIHILPHVFTEVRGSQPTREELGDRNDAEEDWPNSIAGDREDSWRSLKPPPGMDQLDAGAEWLEGSEAPEDVRDDAP